MLATLHRWVDRPIVVIAVVGVTAGTVRLMHLGYPATTVFDEVYYPRAACIYVGYSNDRCGVDTADERYWRTNEWDVGSWVHPPLGKWAIALGELAVGTDAFGWRISAAVAGTLTVMLLAGVAWLLFSSTVWALVTGLLLAFENLHLTVSRTGILDSFVAFWIVLACLCLLLDRRCNETRTVGPRPGEDGSLPPEPSWCPWRLAAGVALGAGIATKWSAATGIFACLIAAYGWDMARRRRAGRTEPLLRTIPREAVGLVLVFLVVPAAVYVISYVPWLHHFDWDVSHWWRTQVHAFEFQTALRPSQEENPSQLAEWQWLLLYRPTLFYKVTDGVTTWGIWANGSPAVFWGSLVAIPYTLVSWIRTREWVPRFIVTTVAALYLPWFLSNHPEYIYYATPLSPFLVLACIYTIRSLGLIRVGEGRHLVRPFLPVAAGFVVIALALSLFFWPTMTAGPLSGDALALRQWLASWR